MPLIAIPPQPVIPPGSGEVLVRVRARESVTLYDKPGGLGLLKVRAHTDSGGPRVYWAQRIRGRWAAVRETDIRGGQVWIKLNGKVALSRTRWAIKVDRSARTLTLRHGAKVVRRARVAVGSSGTPTPLGSYHVTEMLDGKGFYGCCIIAISGVQLDPPAGWPGGNQLAIHGTPAGGTGGASAGCVRAADADLRVIAAHVRAGTPVRVVA
jgi:hypothetical protein